MKELTGTVFDIKKFAIHDGPGIRTTVFLKGCPLTCLWCHNPESQDRNAEISFISEKCIACGYCVAVCPRKGHSINAEGMHVYARSACDACGVCTKECYAEALELIGKEMTVSEVLEEVEKDRAFYETSNGGMTISGGEPLMQYEFTKALLSEAKEKKLHTCLDTCGFASLDKYLSILDFVDIFLYDFKESDPEKHKEYTGVPLEPILHNLHEIDKAGAVTILRCPLIPGLNDREDHFRKIGELAESLNNLLCVNIHPYHPLGSSKSARIAKEYLLPKTGFPENEVVNSWIEKISKYTSKEISKN